MGVHTQTQLVNKQLFYVHARTHRLAGWKRAINRLVHYNVIVLLAVNLWPEVQVKQCCARAVASQPTGTQRTPDGVGVGQMGQTG